MIFSFGLIDEDERNTGTQKPQKLHRMHRKREMKSKTR
jgi:hypothetical protein